MFKSVRLARAWGLVGWAALGCGGMASTSADPNSTSSALPVPGLYAVDLETATDCSPAPRAHETREEQLSPDAKGVNLSFWSNARQDVPWTGLASTFGACQSSVRIQVALESSRSFSVQSDWVWIEPGHCTLGAAELPRSSCRARQVATYQLLDR